MTNSPFSTAAFAIVLLCGTSVLAQQSTEAASPATAPDSAVAASPQPATAAPSDATPAASPEPAAASPGIRIVRLSQVTGDVQLDRQTGRGFESAFANLPITQGGKLRTGVGVAEVEFEDNSSLRLTPHSIVEFPVLSLGPDGIRSSTIHVTEGTVYVSLTKDKQNTVNVTFGRETLALTPGSHMELALNGTQPRLDVMDGTVQAVNGATTTTVGRKKALLFDPANSAAPTLVSKNEKGQFDDWDKQAVEYHQRMAPTGGNYAGIPYAYGLTDMNYYGNFASIGGCGSMWRPYLASSGWSPYDNGVWAWYPNAGYSWVSPYPWGWTAFHSGSWNYCPGAGWGWQPSNQWNGLQNTALIQRPNGPTHLKPPIARPHPASPTMIGVNQKPLVISTLNGKDSFVFRKDSAGLGVPRNTFGKLDHISSGVAQHGTVEKSVFLPSSPNARPAGNEGWNAANRGGVTGAHTMPANGASPMPSHSSPVSGSSSMGGRQSVSGGSLGAPRSSMGGSMGASGAGGGHPASAGHH
jgi:FecR protein